MSEWILIDLVRIQGEIISNKGTGFEVDQLIYPISIQEGVISNSSP